jgi:phospholipid transport system substrate-binding protein
MKPRNERRHQLRAIADDIFDWGEASQRALARHWQPLTAEQRERFVGLFADLIDRTYMSRIEEYSGERIVFLGESIEGDQGTVRTRFLTKQGTRRRGHRPGTPGHHLIPTVGPGEGRIRFLGGER